ncbi:MAG: ketoacyl-ACP synthase III [Puniceicoccales bacterium]|jgi:3-oxoacyl-[acyl-carrier-protein] synthase-3|nr:ketoacyl-ACP synthase III [Puniceicoccales bacterium]
MGAKKEIFIRGIGSYLPKRILTNKDLEAIVETSDEWIVSRTGIRERHIAADDEFTSDMATQAALRAIEDAKIQPREIDCIIVCSVTFDMAFPATACIVQKNLGISECPCMDLEAGCSAFVYSMEVAAGLLQLGCYKNILIIASDKLTSITDWEDRTTCVLFGDGASAVVLTTEAYGARAMLVDTLLRAYGKDCYSLMQPGGGCRHPASAETVEKRMHYLRMNGREVFKSAVRGMGAILKDIFLRNQIEPTDVQHFLPHQANMRIIEAVAETFQISLEKFLIVLHRTGNTSAGSVGIAFDDGYRNGRFAAGDTLSFITFGGGMTCATALVRWLL